MATSDLGGSAARQWVPLVCFVILLLEGYDLAMFGAVVPALLAHEAWQLTPAVVGTIGALSGVGLVLGALSAAFLVDRLGRKTVLLSSTAVFSLGMVVAAIAPSPELLTLGRVLTGIGSGTVMPAVTAMLVEFAPKGRRQQTVSYGFIGVGVGGIVAGLLGVYLLPIIGFRGMFGIGTVALLVLPLLIKTFPESPSYLMSVGQTERARVLARRYGLAEPTPTESERRLGTVDRFRQVFTGGRVIATVLLWGVLVLVQMAATLAGTWLPTLLLAAGYSLGSALLQITVFYVGFVVGNLIVARLADRFGSRVVIVSSLFVATLSYVCLSLGLSPVAVLGLVALIGLGVPGIQSLVNTVVAALYPVEIRGTGLGMAIAIARVGAIIGPLYGGLISAGMPITSQFFAFALPTLAAALVMAFVPRSSVRRGTDDGGEEQPAAVEPADRASG